MTGPSGRRESADFAQLSLADKVNVRLRVAVILEILADTIETSMAGSVSLPGVREMAASVHEINIEAFDEPDARRLAPYVYSEVAELLTVLAERAAVKGLHVITYDQFERLAAIRFDMISRYMMMAYVEQILRAGDGDGHGEMSATDVASWVGMKPGDGVEQIIVALRRLMSI